MRVPINTPSKIKLIVVIHPIRMLYSLPRTLNNLRNHNNKKTAKAHTDTQYAFLTLICLLLEKDSGESFKNFALY